MIQAPTPVDPRQKRRSLILLALAELLGMSVWFSASAVVPALTKVWNLGSSGQAWLTIAVQIGFVAGALASAVLNLADLIPAPRLFTVAAFFAAAFTVLSPVAGSRLPTVVLLRFLTGFSLAGVYPVGMKIMATWTREDRGLGIGLLVGALTVGSAAPHLFNSLGGFGDWKLVLYAAAGLAALGGLTSLLFIQEGPLRVAAPKFDWRYAGRLWREKEIAYANLGYFGHMWELYAMWTWAPVFLLASFELRGVAEHWAGLSGFAVIGIGDSAKFSAGISELCQEERIGTALTLQTSLGFLLTIVTIRLIPSAQKLVGWRWAFCLLSLGPMAGIWAMSRLRRLPASFRMACGRQ
jgi:MFS family permease